MHLGSIRLSEGERKPGGIKSFMLLGKLCLGAAYPHIVWQTSGEELEIGAAPEEWSRMYGGY